MPANPVAPIPVPPVPVSPVPVSPVKPRGSPVGPVGPGVPPSDPGPLLNGPSAVLDGAVNPPVGLFKPPDGPDPPPPSSDVFLDPMLKLLTGPSKLLLLDPVPPPMDVVWLPVWVVVVEWRVIVVADSWMGLSEIVALGVVKGLPGAGAGPWCVLASAVAAAPNAMHIAAAVIAPVMNTVWVHDPCWMLCLATTSPLCNKYPHTENLHTSHTSSGAIIHPPGAIITLPQQIASMN
jgi:hypothetical protein